MSSIHLSASNARTATVILKDRHFSCDVAATEDERRIGLSKHSGLQDGTGLLFNFSPTRTANFWMSDVSFPIDIVGVAPNGVVTKIVADCQPGSTESWAFAQVAHVVEVPAGTCHRYGIKVGDKANVRFGGRVDRRVVAVGTSDKEPWELTFREYIEALGGNKTHPDDAYEGYSAVPFFDRPSTVVDRMTLPDGRTVEFRRSNVGEKYNDGTTKKEKSIYAVLEGWTIGAVQDEWGATLVRVDPEFRHLGIGSRLTFLSRQQWPQRGSGGMTPQGYSMNSKLHEIFVADALARGKTVPPSVLAEYPGIEPVRMADQTPDSGEPVTWVGPKTNSIGALKPLEELDSYERSQIERGEWPRINPERHLQYGHPLASLFEAMGKPLELGKTEHPTRTSYWYRWPKGQPTYQETLDFLKSKDIRPDNYHQYSWYQSQLEPDAPKRPQPPKKEKTASVRVAAKPRKQDTIQSRIWYHGDTSKRLTFENQRFQNRDNWNAMGPGIYFTSDKDQAAGYAHPNGYVYTVTVDGKFVTDDQRPTLAEIRKFLSMLDTEGREYLFSNFDENPARAQRMIETAYSSVDFVSTFADLGRQGGLDYSTEGRAWCAAMVKLGYTGVLHKLPSVDHLIVWDPSKISVSSIEALAELLKLGEQDTPKTASVKLTGTSKIPTSEEIASAAAEVAKRSVRDEREKVRKIVQLTLIPAVGPEDWDLRVLEGKMAMLDAPAGRIVIGDPARPDAALSWATEHNKPYVHNLWVAEDLRGRGVARVLFDAYRQHVNSHVVSVGPFSAAGLAISQTLADRVSKNPPKSWKKPKTASIKITAAPKLPPYLYHVTRASALSGIIGHGLRTNEGGASTFSGYGGNARGRLFLTSAEGAHYWFGKIQDQVEHHYEGPLAVAEAPVILRVETPNLDRRRLRQDEVANKESISANAWHYTKTIPSEQLTGWDADTQTWVPLEHINAEALAEMRTESHGDDEWQEVDYKRPPADAFSDGYLDKSAAPQLTKREYESMKKDVDQRQQEEKAAEQKAKERRQKLQKARERDRDLASTPSTSTPSTKTAQIVDEGKFVDKVSRILFGKLEEMVWTPDALNGGATERSVVTRAELSRWLASEVPDEDLTQILNAAGSDRGLSLVGDAAILAGIADIARVGFAGRQPMLVLYRTPK